MGFEINYQMGQQTACINIEAAAATAHYGFINMKFLLNNL